MPGCIAFSCFGAGQRVTAAFNGVDPRAVPELAPEIFAAFDVMLQLHTLLWHVDAGLLLPVTVHTSTLRRHRTRLEALASTTPREAALSSLRQAVSATLRSVSAVHRKPAGPDLSRTDHFGADLEGAALERADLFATVLVGARLFDADLRGADLRGADLRGADLRGADLRGAIFLTPSQVSSARGDRRTRLPFPTPPHWI